GGGRRAAVAAREARLRRRPRARVQRLGREGEPRGTRRRDRAHRPGRARGTAEGERVSERYEVARLDDLDRIPVGERGLEWRPIRRRSGPAAFGTNPYSSPPAAPTA